MHENALTVCVDGRGDGPIMLVGQNPGAQEDLEGVAFLGKSGKLIDSMLADAGYDPSQVRLTNAVRCKTPDNRPPTPAEIEACRVHLQAEIRERNPETIIALGDTALRSLTKRSGVSSKRGTELRLHKLFERDQSTWVTLRPAYVLRTPPSRDTVVADLRKFREGEREADVPWSWAEYPAPGTVCAFDIETDWDSKTKRGGDHITQIAYATEGGTNVSHSLGGVEALSRFDTIVGHNSWSFDLPKLREATGLDLPMGDDTMVLAYLDNETQPLGLESLAVKYLGVPGWKEGIHADLGSDDFALYNARDSRYTLDLHRDLCTRLGARKTVADRIIRPAFVALRECTELGIFISRDSVKVAREHFQTKKDYGAKALHVLGGVENPNSTVEVAAALMRAGYTLPQLSSGGYSTDSGVLSSLPTSKLLQAVKYYRKATKALQAVEAYSKLAETGDGRAHPTYTLWRTVTGRTSASNPNVQNLARDPLLRNFFSAPPGSEYWTVDYAAIEFRGAAYIAGATSIIDRYAADPEWDPHRFVASILYSKPESEIAKDSVERQVAKSANFGLLYMAQWFTLQEYARKTAGLELSMAECQRIRRVWHETFPEFRAWYARTAADLKRQGYIQSLTGRRRNFGDTSLLSDAQFQEALREAVNFQVQSLAADIALIGLAACHQAGLPINGFFHDAISFEVDGAELLERNGHEHTCRNIGRCLADIPREYLRQHFNFDFNIPLIVEAKVKAHGRDTRTFIIRPEAL